MMFPVVELRVWTCYPGQFPGQVDVEDRTSYMLEDPGGHMSVLIKKGSSLGKQLREARSRSRLRDSLKERWVLWESKRTIRRLISLTKQALKHVVVTLAEPVDVLENYEKSRVLQSINKATRLDFIARRAAKPFDGKTLTFIAYVSTISE